MDKVVATERLMIVISAIVFPPMFCLIVLIFILATFGKSFGIRRKYVAYLLKLFEWGRKEMDEAKRQALLYGSMAEDSESSDSEHSKEGASTYAPSSPHSTVSREVSGPSLNYMTQFEKCEVIIKREASIRILQKLRNKLRVHDFGSFAFRTTEDTFDFIKAGVEAIIEDDVTNRFEAEELACWNLLTRTSYGYHFANWKLGLLWLCGFIWRYFVLFPNRLVFFGIGLVWLVVCTAVIGYIPDGEENNAQSGGICVANHTSPIDILMLACNNCYALVGQKHGGLLGIAQRALSRASSHIWFERSEATDRAAVARRLRNHVSDKNKLPILIFPEGTCINNTSVMMFKKGSFEVGAKIYPVAIKYDPRFGDPFWNSSRQAWMEYLIQMMTSWAIVCDVWYLPPMERKVKGTGCKNYEEGEDAISFANRVKRKIAKAGGLVDMDWDGQLKRTSVPDKMKEKTKELYARRVENAVLTVYENGIVNNTNDSNYSAEITEKGKNE